MMAFWPGWIWKNKYRFKQYFPSFEESHHYQSEEKISLGNNGECVVLQIEKDALMTSITKALSLLEIMVYSK